MGNDAAALVDGLIASGAGDAGRLRYIRGRLAAGLPLYASDRAYVESKLGGPLPAPRPAPGAGAAGAVAGLLAAGAGDRGRLEHMRRALEAGEELRGSDRRYLEAALASAPARLPPAPAAPPSGDALVGAALDREERRRREAAGRRRGESAAGLGAARAARRRGAP